MGEVKHNTALLAAVQDLYNKEIIKKDKDIVDKTGYSKGTVSGYISGNAKASEEFLNKFEEAFGIRLSDYPNGRAETPQRALPGSVTLQDHIDLLKKQAATAEADKDKLFTNNETLARALDKLGSIYEMFITNSNVTKEQLDAIVDQVRAEHAVMMDALDRLEKNKVGTSAMQAGNLEIERKNVRSGRGKQVGARK